MDTANFPLFSIFLLYLSQKCNINIYNFGATSYLIRNLHDNENNFIQPVIIKSPDVSIKRRRKIKSIRITERSLSAKSAICPQ